MKALVLTMGQDTAGQGIRIREGFARLYPSDTVRVITSTRTYIQYPIDLPFSMRRATALWKESDVVHLRNNFDGWTTFGRPYERRRFKPMVLHHHGTHYRENYAKLTRMARQMRVVEIASTVDLLQYNEENVVWLPAPYHLPSLRALRGEREPGPFRIVHAPTNREIKDTDSVLAAVEALRQRHEIEFDLIEKATWRECLRRKARADLLIDQLQLGYGCNAIEAWAMGIPVVAGTTDPWTRAKMIDLWGELPFVEATTGDLVEVIDGLITSPSAYAEATARGTQHVERYHAEEVVLPQVRKHYEHAILRQR